jgi:hypothetical protein
MNASVFPSSTGSVPLILKIRLTTKGTMNMSPVLLSLLPLHQGFVVRKVLLDMKRITSVRRSFSMTTFGLMMTIRPTITKHLTPFMAFITVSLMVVFGTTN